MDTTTAPRRNTVELMGHTTDLVIVVDRDLTIQALSASLGRIVGVDDDFVGSLDGLVHPHDRRAFERIIEPGTAEPGDNERFRVRDREGAWRSLSMVARTWHGPKDHCVVICRESLDRNRLPLLLRRATEASNEASDLDAVLRLVAADISTTLGWPAAAVFRADGSSLTPAGGESALGSPEATAVREEAGASARPACLTGGSADGEWTYVAVPVVADARTAAVLLFASSGGAVPAELPDVLTSISWQLGMVAARHADRQALERRDAELQRSNAELERFAYVASHDLQEPLRKIVTACDLLQERAGAELAASSGGKYVDIAVDAARRMQTLISDLLAYSRIGRGETPDVDVDLDALVADVCASLSDRIEEAQALVDIGKLPTVRAGNHEVRQVFTNLLSNALKFRSADPLVSITARTEAAEVHVTVTDNGVGIAPEYRERIFDVFRRLHRQDEYDGTGIGLSIAKRIVEHHGGRMWVTADPSGGSQFHFTLPAGPS